MAYFERYAFYTSQLSKKQKDKFLQELCEHISVNDVHYSTQVICNKHKSCIGAGMFYSFLSDDVIKPHCLLIVP